MRSTVVTLATLAAAFTRIHAEQPASNMITQIGTSSALAIPITRRQDQNVLAAILAYDGGWVEDELRCADGDLVSSVSVVDLHDQTCHPAANVDCLTGVKRDRPFGCHLTMYNDSVCTQQESHNWYDLW